MIIRVQVGQGRNGEMSIQRKGTKFRLDRKNCFSDLLPNVYYD